MQETAISLEVQPAQCSVYFQDTAAAVGVAVTLGMRPCVEGLVSGGKAVSTTAGRVAPCIHICTGEEHTACFKPPAIKVKPNITSI
jgi:hypothetical protein